MNKGPWLILRFSFSSHLTTVGEGVGWEGSKLTCSRKSLSSRTQKENHRKQGGPTGQWIEPKERCENWKKAGSTSSSLAPETGALWGKGYNSVVS